MGNKPPEHNMQAIYQACNEIQRGLLHLFKELIADKGVTSNPKIGVAIPPTPTTIAVDEWIEACALWEASGLSLVADLPARNCPACNSSQSHQIFQSYDGYHFNECNQCGTWYVPKVVDWSLFERFFSQSASARMLAKKVASNRLDHLEPQELPRFQSYFKAIMNIMPSSDLPRSYLDIGCGVGHSLKAAKSMGMEPHGVEVDPDFAALAKRNCDVVVNTINNLPVGTYDVISMWETLEHLADPLSMLIEAKNKLAVGGLIAVTVPNLNALPVRILREKCSYVYGGYNSPGHINFFNKRTIELLFRQAGLTLVEVSYEFSSNANELFGYLGDFRSIYRPFSVAAPQSPVVEILNAIWPSVTLIEDLAGTLPIMQCIACRPEATSLFSEKCKERSLIHMENKCSEANQQLAEITDPIQRIKELEELNMKLSNTFETKN